MQSLGAWPLLVLGLAVAAGVGAAPRHRWLLLLRRSRWLLAVLVLTLLLSTPGEALLPGFPGTHEGILAALEQGLRFLLILGAVAWLLDHCRHEQLIAGFYSLSLPLRRLGCPTERAIVRLVLVLEEIEHGKSGRDWRQLLATPAQPAVRTLELELPVWRRQDLGITLLGLLLLAATILGGR